MLEIPAFPSSYPSSGVPRGVVIAGDEIRGRKGSASGGQSTRQLRSQEQVTR
jgi:hypothetical protein